jgi:hypothetical protein
MDSLMDQSRGFYRVRTESSCYFISLDLNVFRRHPAAGSPTEIAALRRDRDQIDLLAVWECKVGSPMLLVADLHLPFVPFTLRRSMPVVSIERLSDVDEAVLL